MSESLHAAKSDEEGDGSEAKPEASEEANPAYLLADLESMRVKEVETPSHVTETADRSKVTVAKWLDELHAGFYKQFGDVFKAEGYEHLGELLGMPEDELMTLLDNLHDAHPNDGAKVEQISRNLIEETLAHKKYLEEIREQQKKEERRKRTEKKRKKRAIQKAEDERIKQRRAQEADEKAAAIEAHYAQIAQVDAEIDRIEKEIVAAQRKNDSGAVEELTKNLVDAKAKRDALTEETELDRAGDEKADDGDDDEKRGGNARGGARRSSQPVALSSLEAFVAAQTAGGAKSEDEGSDGDDDDDDGHDEDAKAKPLSARELALVRRRREATPPFRPSPS